MFELVVDMVPWDMWEVGVVLMVELWEELAPVVWLELPELWSDLFGVRWPELSLLGVF